MFVDGRADIVTGQQVKKMDAWGEKLEQGCMTPGGMCSMGMWSWNSGLTWARAWTWAHQCLAPSIKCEILIRGGGSCFVL